MTESEDVCPRSPDIQISGELYVSTSLTDEEVSAGIFIPDNKRNRVLIRVAAGDYAETVQRDGCYAAGCSILASVAHEITHYYQWVVDHDCVFDEAQARAKAKRTVLRHYRTMMTVQMRRQKFRQMKQNSARAVTPARRDFVKYDGIYASRCAVKASAAHCAVMP